MERKREPEEIQLTGLYTRNLGANLLGLITVVVLNLFTPLELFEIDKAIILVERRWVIALKYLTSLAQKQGLLGFTADVLVDNQPMLHVFQKMGFDIQKSISAGVFELKMMFRG